MKTAVLISITKNVSEIAALLNTLGYNVACTVFQNMSQPNPRSYIGRGKIQEIKKLLENEKADIIVVNGLLKPGQHYILETELNTKVFDRIGIILEIFVTRAHSKEAMLQVELAKYQYELPFVREWIHRAKSSEHPGFMASGGYQLDQYYEFIRRRMSKIRKELHLIEMQKATNRQKRSDAGVFTVSIAGYTNAGKSSLLNLLTKSNALVADEPFTTLDTLTRRFNPLLDASNKNNSKTIVITDTIGLINDVPPWMLVSFRATLDEIRNSDCILLLIDAADSIDSIIEKYNLAESILKDHHNKTDDPKGRQILILLNKIDKISDEKLYSDIEMLKNVTEYTIIPISITKNIGVNQLIESLIRLSIN